MTTQLYYAAGTCSLAVHVVLREVGAEFELIKEDIKAKPRNPEYLKLNPRGSVPVLVVDGKVLREGAAILTYIAGNTITLADILLSVIASWTPMVSPQNTFGEKTKAYFEKIRNRPSYAASVDAEKQSKQAA